MKANIISIVRVLCLLLLFAQQLVAQRQQQTSFKEVGTDDLALIQAAGQLLDSLVTTNIILGDPFVTFKQVLSYDDENRVNTNKLFSRDAMTNELYESKRRVYIYGGNRTIEIEYTSPAADTPLSPFSQVTTTFNQQGQTIQTLLELFDTATQQFIPNRFTDLTYIGTDTIEYDVMTWNLNTQTYDPAERIIRVVLDNEGFVDTRYVYNLQTRAYELNTRFTIINRSLNVIEEVHNEFWDSNVNAWQTSSRIRKFFDEPKPYAIGQFLNGNGQLVPGDSTCFTINLDGQIVTDTVFVKDFYGEYDLSRLELNEYLDQIIQSNQYYAFDDQTNNFNLNSRSDYFYTEIISTSSNELAVEGHEIKITNPVDQELTVTCMECAYPMTYQVVNLQGQVLRKGKLLERVNQLSVSDLSDGLYFLQLAGKQEQGNDGVKVLKFVKQ